MNISTKKSVGGGRHYGLIFSLIPALFVMPAFGYLQVSIYATLGSPCYSECTSDGCNAVLRKCGGKSVFFKDDPGNGRNCPATYDQYLSSGLDCFLGEDSDGNRYFCGKDYEPGCSFCMIANLNNDLTWKDIGGNRVSRTSYSMSSFESTDYSCIPHVNEEIQYGCAKNYYKSAGSGATMTCTVCPDGGSSSIGNTDKTGCYLPAGTSFSDSAGSGTYSDNCYYSD